MFSFSGIPFDTDFGAISKGVWHRLVTRMRMANPGNYQVWVDGTQRASLSCNCVAPGGSVL